MREKSHWPILLVVMGCAAAAAGIEVAFAFDAQREWDATLLTLDVDHVSTWTFGPRDYLPGAASMAAVSLLCNAIGGQVLERRPLRSLIALSLVTGTFLVSSFAIAYPYADAYGYSMSQLVDLGLPVISGRLPRFVISVWVGTLVLWIVGTPSLAADQCGECPTADARGPEEGLRLATHRTIAALVVAALVAVHALIVFFAMGGLQLFFGRAAVEWPQMFSSTPAVLAPVAIVGGWLLGRGQTGRHRTLWSTIILIGVALSAVDGLGTDISGTLAIPVLAAFGTVLAASRQNLAQSVANQLAR